MGEPGVRRNIFQRIFGICATRPPADEGCWKLEGEKIAVDLTRASEISEPGGAMRLEGKGDPGVRVLVFRGPGGEYRALRNECAHAKRRLDPIPGAQRVQCCSLGRSTYGYDGKLVSGMARGDVRAYEIEVDGDRLVIDVG